MYVKKFTTSSVGYYKRCTSCTQKKIGSFFLSHGVSSCLLARTGNCCFIGAERAVCRLRGKRAISGGVESWQSGQDAAAGTARGHRRDDDTSQTHVRRRAGGRKTPRRGDGEDPRAPRHSLRIARTTTARDDTQVDTDPLVF